jgi:hypothetical protein
MCRAANRTRRAAKLEQARRDAAVAFPRGFLNDIHSLHVLLLSYYYPRERMIVGVYK